MKDITDELSEELDKISINPDDTSNHDSSVNDLKTRFEKERLEWTQKIKKMSAHLKNIIEIPDLMVELYTERQRTLEYYHYILSLLIGINKAYRAKYAERFDYYTNKTQVRYPNETSKHNRIQVDMAQMIEKREALENHSKYILRTIESIDNIIYAVPKRLEAENFIRGK